MCEKWLALIEVSHFQHDYSSKTRRGEKIKLKRSGLEAKFV